MTNQNNKKPKLRFGMRIAAVLVTVCCILFAWIGKHYQSARSEQAAIAKIRELGFEVSVGYGYSTGKFGIRVPGDASPGHPWVRKLFGDYLFSRVTVLRLRKGGSELDLKGLSHLVSLDLSTTKIDNLEALRGLRNLQKLSLFDCEKIESLTPLTGMQELRTINIGDTNIHSLKGLESATKLVSFNASVTPVESLDELENAKNLRRVDASYCQSLSHIDGLSGRTKIEYLRLVGCNALENIGPVEQMVSMTSLQCDGKRLRISSPELLNGLTELYDLDVSGCHSWTSTDELASLKQLSEIYICDCNSLQNLSGLSQLEHLWKMQIWRCAALDDLSEVKRMKLEELILYGWNIEHPNDCFHQLSSVKALTLWNSSTLADLDGIEALAGVEELSIMECDQLTDIDGLKWLTQLRKLNIFKCKQIAKEDVDRIARLLPNTRVQYTVAESK